MKPSGIGGMAVTEGVMMKNKEKYAIAVRKSNKEIVVEKGTHNDFSDKVKLFKLPIFRGMLAFVDSVVIGVKAINYSTSIIEEDETKQVGQKGNTKKTTTASDNTSNPLLMVLAVVVSIIASVALFMVLPVLLTQLFSRFIMNTVVLAVLEAFVRVSVFVVYGILASRMPEIKRAFMYHGAEHKVLNCLENGFELTVENVKWQSKLHKRCKTSFIFLVLLLSIIIFLVLPAGNLAWRIISRIILLPIIAGFSYEFILIAGKSENKAIDILSKPVFWMQGLTTREPEDSMIEVAIASVSAVFDWKLFLDVATTKESKKNKKAKSNAKLRNQKQKVIDKVENEDILEEELMDEEFLVDMTNIKSLDEATIMAEVELTEDTDAGQDVAITEESSAKIRGKSALSGENSRRRIYNPVTFKPVRTSNDDEEDDEILKALDKFFDEDSREK